MVDVLYFKPNSNQAMLVPIMNGLNQGFVQRTPVVVIPRSVVAIPRIDPAHHRGDEV